MTTIDPDYEFKLRRFNPRRAMRHAPAAEVLVTCDGEDIDLLWMDERDIELNMKEFGPHPELLKAKEAYRTRKEFPPVEKVATGRGRE